EGRTAINAGFLAGHSTIRRLVMGPDAVEAAATDDQIDAMCALLDRAVADGALGLSTSLGSTHHDGDGNPVPSRLADRRELVALAEVLRAKPGTLIGINPGVVPFERTTVELLTDMA